MLLLAATLVASARPVPYFGVNQDFVWTKDSDIRPLIQAMKDAHIQAVRMPFRWNVIEPEPGRWNLTKLDAIVHALREARIEILPVLMGIPAWSSGIKPGTAEGFPDVYPPNKIEGWENYVRVVATRYHKEIRFWEIWNEENGVDFFRPTPDAVKYVTLLKAAHDAIKQVNSRAVIVMGGLQMNGIIPNPWSPLKVENFLQQIYDAGGRPYFDVVNIHPYVLATQQEGPAYAASLVRETLDEMKRNKDQRKPLWITETGIATGNGVTEQIQADHLAGIYREISKIKQVKAVYWFLLRDMDTAVLGGENSMGIIAVDGRRKPAFGELQRASH